MSDKDAKLYFSVELLTWYRSQKRDLPWRRTRNPYYIWISEVMLQQTRVETVKPYFERFVSLFPTVEALAEAPEETVLKAWEGLGYYSRARNLQSAAREVAEKYGGKVPDEKEKFAALKGVGPYTAGAVMSIAFNRREPAVDGNVMRVLSRYFCIEEDIAKGGTRALMERLQYELIPDGEASDFNQAIMELGALVCTPKSPHCLTCPVMEMCAGRLAGKEETLPIKTKAKPPRPEYRACAFVVSADGRSVLLRQRPAAGLLAGMWELPHTELAAALPDGEVGDALAGWLADELAAASEAAAASLTDAPLDATSAAQLESSAAAQLDAPPAVPLDVPPAASIRAYGAAIRPEAPIGVYEHVFSHIYWNLRVHQLTGPAGEPPAPYRWADREGLAQYPLPNVFIRMLRDKGWLN